MYSAIMALVYGFYTFGILGNNNTKKCVTNYVDFTPFPYSTTTELEAYMKHPGALDMSSRFHTVMMFGFVANIVFIM